MTTTVSTRNPLAVDRLTREGGSERRTAYLAIAAAYGRYTETELEIGQLLRTVYEKELYRDSVSGSGSWAEFLAEELPDLTGGVILTHSEAARLIDFAFFRDELQAKVPNLGDRPLPPTPQHVEPLRALEDTDLCVRAWQIACDGAIDGVPSVRQVELAAQLVRER